MSHFLFCLQCSQECSKRISCKQSFLLSCNLYYRLAFRLPLPILSTQTRRHFLGTCFTHPKMKTLRRSYGRAQTWALISTRLSSGILSRHFLLQEQDGSIGFTCSAGLFFVSSSEEFPTWVRRHVLEQCSFHPHHGSLPHPAVGVRSYLFALVVLYGTNIGVCT